MAEWMSTALATYFGFGVMVAVVATAASLVYVVARFVLCRALGERWPELDEEGKGFMVGHTAVGITMLAFLATVLGLASQEIARAFGWLN